MKGTILSNLRRLAVLAVSSVLASAPCSCGNNGEPPEETPWLTDVVIESSYTFGPGDAVPISGKGFQAGDILTMNGAEYGLDKSFHLLDLTDISASGASFTVPEKMVTGKYDFTAARTGSPELALASGVSVKMNTDPVDIPDVAGKNIKGRVSCDGQPLKDVVVTDGYEVTVTDENGFYYLESEKLINMVYISIPGGYMPSLVSGTNVPEFYSHLTKGVDEVDRHDFELRAEPNDRHCMLFGADFHMANRTGDKAQFRLTFIPDVKDVAAVNDAKGIPTYFFTLGDVTWDQFWLSNSYRLNHFVTDSDMRSFRSMSRILPFFNCMGNHDNDPSIITATVPFTVDLRAEGEWRKYVGPVYYSFNIGKVHYIVIDDVEYLNANGDRNSNYTFAARQTAWLKKDLDAVTDKTTPIVVGTHAPAHRVTGAASNATGNAVVTNSIGNFTLFMNAFAGFDDVTIYSGHLHTAFNVVSPSYPHVTERNLPAVCATWWWTGNHLGSTVQVCTDGSPGGFGILNVDGKNSEYHFKGHGLPLTKQFRTYDRNTIEMTGAKYGNTRFTSTYTSPYHTASSSNQVIINVWNWGPGWSIAVTENTPGGKTALMPTPAFIKDPYHMVTYELQRLNSSATTEPTSTFLTATKHHFFTVTASAPDTTLDIVVKDSYGNEYTEAMTRPKAFPVTKAEIQSYYDK